MTTSQYKNWSPPSEASDNLSDCEDRESSCPSEGKGRRLWKKVKYQLVGYHSLPGYLRDNEFILDYYRAEWPLKQVLLSVFYIHNETLNVWTHLMGFLLFLCLTIYTAMKVPHVVHLNSLQRLSEILRGADLHKIQSELVKCLPNVPDIYRLKDGLMPASLSKWHIVELLSSCFSFTSQTDGILQGVKEDAVELLVVEPITRWPFFTFLGGAMFCLLASSTCHLLACHSERLSYIMLRIDYTGISILIATSFYPPVYYSFMCNPFLCNLYLSFITILGITTIAFALLPVFQKPRFRPIRASLFLGMGLSGVAPVIHKMILFKDQPAALQTTRYEVLMGALYILGALIYVLRVPERWKPGKFDIAGHSHQLFHVLVVAGAYTHYHAGLIYLNWRDKEGCPLLHSGA